MKLTIRNGQLYPTPPDGEYLLTKWIPPRNVEQNKLLFALYTLVERETGNDKEALHELMKKEYLSRRKLVKIGGKKKYVNIVKSSTKLNRKEFSEFFSQVEQFFAKHGYVLPPIDSPEFQSLIHSLQ